MGTIHIDLPESVLLATGQSEEEFVREAMKPRPSSRSWSIWLPRAKRS